MSELFTEHASWPDRPGDDDLRALPARPAVLLMHDASGAAVQLMATQSLRRALQSRLIDAALAGGGRTDVGEVVRGVRWRPVSSAFEARWRHWQAARQLYPREYRDQLMFGPAWFLHFDPAATTAEIRLTEHVWRDAGEYVGTWPTRAAAQTALETLWDLFDLCRHPEQMRRAPRGERCAYAEMGRCDAPCDGSASLADYRARCVTAWRFAAGATEDWQSAASARMKAAAAERQFERAGLIKQQLHAAAGWQSAALRGVRPDGEMRWLLGVPTTGRRKWKAFLFDRGVLEEGPETSAAKLIAACETWLSGRPAADVAAMEASVRAEQTWLMCHFLGHSDSRQAMVVDAGRIEQWAKAPRLFEFPKHVDASPSESE